MLVSDLQHGSRLYTYHLTLVGLQRRKEILLDAFAGRRIKNLSAAQTPFATLVKKLQESLTRMESFDVITVTQNSDGQFRDSESPHLLTLPLDSKRSSPSLLARQLRLRLVAGDESDIPRNLHNIVVSIHAIATFQALHDYLRPRVAGLLSGSSRLSGMFAALAASGFVGSSSKPSTDEASSAPKLPVPNPPAEPSSSTVQRRRSQRLAKQAASASSPETSPTTTTAPTDSGPADAGVPSSSSQISPETSSMPNVPAVEPAPSDTIVDSELQADFSDDDEIDAEVFDDEVDPDTSISEKTITLSIAEGMSPYLLMISHINHYFRWYQG